MSNYRPSVNTASVLVSGCSTNSAATRHGYVRLRLSNASATYPAPNAATTIPANAISFASLAPSKLSGYLCGAVNTEARGMWAIIATDDSLSDTAITEFFPANNTLAVSIAARSDITTRTAQFAGDAPNYADIVSGFESPHRGDLDVEQFGGSGRLHNTLISTSAMNSGTWTKSATDISGSMTRTIDRHGGAYGAYMVLGSGLFNTRQASSTAFTTAILPEVDVPTRYDMLALNSYGWPGVCFYLVYRSTAPVDVTEAVLMISPKWSAKPFIPRDVSLVTTLPSSGVHLIANVQPITVSFQAGSSPLQVTTPTGLPMATVVTNTVNTASTGTVSVDFPAGKVIPVCGSPWPHPRVAVSSIRVSGLGEDIDRPITVTNRPLCEEVVLTPPFYIPPNATAPMVVTSDIPINPSTGVIEGDVVAQPLRTVASGSVSVQPAAGAVFPVTQAAGSEFTVAQAAGSVFDVRAGPDQEYPFWTSDVDPDN